MLKLLIFMAIYMLINVNAYSSQSWFNYKTSSYDELDGLPENYEDYLPQVIGAEGLYRTKMAMGKAPTEAYIEVMEFIVNRSEQAKTDNK